MAETLRSTLSHFFLFRVGAGLRPLSLVHVAVGHGVSFGSAAVQLFAFVPQGYYPYAFIAGLSSSSSSSSAGGSRTVVSLPKLAAACAAARTACPELLKLDISHMLFDKLQVRMLQGTQQYAVKLGPTGAR
jgi:hypothetical protein